MIDLKALLSEVSQKHRWNRAEWGWILQASWSETVGPMLASHSRVIGLRDRSIIIAVPSSSWSQELVYWKPEMLSRIRELLGERAAIEEIQIRVLPRLFVTHSIQEKAPSEPGGPQAGILRTTDDLTQIFDRTRSKHQAAVAHWTQDGYHPCAECHAPTLSSYRLCASCQARRS